MKFFATSVLAAVLAGFCTTTSAQKLSSAWFAGAGAGVAVHDNSAFSDRLQSWSPRGERGMERVYRTGRFSSTGFSVNAGAGFLFGSGFLAGASGEYLIFPTVEAVTTGDDRSEYALTGGGGQLELGYAILNDDAALVWPYVSLGYYGYNLDFTNNQIDSVPFFEGEPVAPGTTATYTGAAFRPGIGIGFTRYIGGGDNGTGAGGLILAARLGWGMFLSHPVWNHDGEPVRNGGNTPCYDGVSLSITIGGGSGSF